MLYDKKIIAVLINRITKPFVRRGRKWQNLKARVQIPPSPPFIQYSVFDDGSIEQRVEDIV